MTTRGGLTAGEYQKLKREAFMLVYCVFAVGHFMLYADYIQKDFDVFVDSLGCTFYNNDTTRAQHTLARVTVFFSSMIGLMVFSFLFPLIDIVVYVCF